MRMQIPSSWPGTPKGAKRCIIWALRTATPLYNKLCLGVTCFGQSVFVGNYYCIYLVSTRDAQNTHGRDDGVCTSSVAASFCVKIDLKLDRFIDGFALHAISGDTPGTARRGWRHKMLRQVLHRSTLMYIYASTWHVCAVSRLKNNKRWMVGVWQKTSPLYHNLWLGVACFGKSKCSLNSALDTSLFPNANIEIRMESAWKHAKTHMERMRKRRQKTVSRDTVSAEEHAWDQQKRFISYTNWCTVLFLWPQTDLCLEMLRSLPQYRPAGTICMPKQATEVPCEQAAEPSLLSTCRFYLLAQARPKSAKRCIVWVW